MRTVINTRKRGGVYVAETEKPRHVAPEGWAHVAHDLIEAIAIVAVVALVLQAVTGAIW